MTQNIVRDTKIQLQTQKYSQRHKNIVNDTKIQLVTQQHSNRHKNAKTLYVLDTKKSYRHKNKVMAHKHILRYKTYSETQKQIQRHKNIFRDTKT